MSGRRNRKFLAGGVGLLALVTALAVTMLGFGVTSSSAKKPGANIATVYIKLGPKGNPYFQAPKTARRGARLRVVNTTSPKQIGPHTFSLVKRRLQPTTRPERRKCFTPGHICFKIAIWHKAGPNTPPKVNPVEVGRKGWSTPGTLARKGDSWFTSGRGQSITQKISAVRNGGPKQLFFMCAVHPWMHGKIRLIP